MDIQLYDASSIDSLDWPETADGSYAKKCLLLLVKGGISTFIGNIEARFLAMKAGNIVLPIVVTNGLEENSWVCSSTAQYVGYGVEYTSLINNPVLAGLVQMTLKGIGLCAAKTKLDTAIYVNNWLFAVDLYPEGFSEEHIAAITGYCTENFPFHALIFRSLNPLLHDPLIHSFKQAGFGMIVSRYVHLTDTNDDALFHTRIIKSDLKLLRESSFQVLNEDQVDPSEYSDILKLYNSLYITHHSSRNPQINEKYMKLLFESGLLKFKVLKLKNQIRGVAGFVERNGIFLCPFFGYEKTDPDHNTIYRLLNTVLLLEAQKKKLIFHQSAGASFYKTIRRAKSCYEYYAIYTRHLPFKQKCGWSTLKVFINTVAPPFMKKY